MENSRRNSRRIIYFINSFALSVEQLNFILMILSINKLCLDSQKTLVTLFISKNIEREAFT